MPRRPGSIDVDQIDWREGITDNVTISGSLTGSHIGAISDTNYDIGTPVIRWRNVYSETFVGELDGAIGFEAKNDAGDQLNKGEVVYIKGVSGNYPTIDRANAADPSAMPAFGLVSKDVAHDSIVQVVTFGIFRKIDTSAFTVGDTLYVNTGSGEFSNIKPTGSNNLIQNIGRVIRVDASVGSIRVGGAGRTNDVPNLDSGNIFFGSATNSSSQRKLNLNLSYASGSGRTIDTVLSKPVRISGSANIYDSLSIGTEARFNKKAISFDGTDDHIVVPDQDDFSFTDGSNDQPFSISAWVYVGDVSSDDGPFVAKANFSDGDTEFIFKHANGNLQLFIYDRDGSASGHYIRALGNSAVLSDATWHHVVATYDGSESQTGINLYVDSAVAASTKSTAGPYGRVRNTTTPLTIGATEDLANANRIFEDRMADVCIFNKELSSSEITELYNSGKIFDLTRYSAYDNIVSWWKMGDSLDDVGTGGVKDYVSGYHGTLTNGASIIDAPSDISEMVNGGFDAEGKLHIVGQENGTAPVVIIDSDTSGTPLSVRTHNDVSEISGSNEVFSISGNGDTLISNNLTVSGSTSVEDYIVFSVTADNTDLQTGTSQMTFRTPFAMELYQVPRASLSTASTSGAVTVDINNGGTTIFSTNLTIDANESTSTTAATAAVLSQTSIADDAQITIDVDGAGTGARGLKVTLYYRRIV